MVHKFTQTPVGNLTVLDYNDSLLIWIDGVSYMTTNPTTQSPTRQISVNEIDLDGLKTPDEFKRAIDEYMANQTK